MENKEKDIKSLGTAFEVVTPAPAAPAPAPQGNVGGPLRGAVAKCGLGLLLALAGLLLPYGAPEFAVVKALAITVVSWQLLTLSMARVKPVNQVPLPLGAALAIASGALGIMKAGDTGVGLIGGAAAVLGGLLSIAGPAMAKKADSKLPPAAQDSPVDDQFSKSLLAYLLILAFLPMSWANGEGSTGVATYLGALTFVFCVLGAWASWVGMWKMWQMPAVSTGFVGLALFLAPLEAFLVGALGLVRVLGGDSAPADFLKAWPGNGAQDFVQYGVPPLVVLLAACLATFELVQGAKKGMASNKQKKDAEIEARKAERAARRGDQKPA